MKKCDLKVGQVLQYNPDHPYFPGQLLVVTDPKDFGCQGYLLQDTDQDLGLCRYKGFAYLRPTFDQVEHVGYLHWMARCKEEISKDESED